MSALSVLVTGANGFIGRQLVRILLDKGFRVRAGIHQKSGIKNYLTAPSLETVKLDVLDRSSLKDALKGMDHVYHFAAKINNHLTKQELYQINVEGTRNVWEVSGQMGLKKALFCSTTAVYGLLCGNQKKIDEKMIARAVEPYGRSKLEAEKQVREISTAHGLDYVIIRPVAVFGPGEHTHFGKQLRSAAFSKLLLSGGFKNRRFSFVHVFDVATAAIHLMQRTIEKDPVFNIAVNQPISYEEAFRAYMQVLDRPGYEYLKLRWLGRLSLVIDQLPEMSGWLNLKQYFPFSFRIWRPGFDMMFSSEKLLSTSFHFRWIDFEDILGACLNERQPLSY